MNARHTEGGSDPAERIPDHRLPNKNERNAVRAYDKGQRETKELTSTFRTNERDMPKRPPKTKVRTKGGTTKLTVDPEMLQRYFERTKSDSNRNARYSPPIVNRRLQK